MSVNVMGTKEGIAIGTSGTVITLSYLDIINGIVALTIAILTVILLVYKIRMARYTFKYKKEILHVEDNKNEKTSS